MQRKCPPRKNRNLGLEEVKSRCKPKKGIFFFIKLSCCFVTTSTVITARPRNWFLFFVKSLTSHLTQPIFFSPVQVPALVLALALLFVCNLKKLQGKIRQRINSDPLATQTCKNAIVKQTALVDPQTKWAVCWCCLFCFLCCCSWLLRWSRSLLVLTHPRACNRFHRNRCL